MQPTGVHHVAVNVTDVAQARAFYCDLLGLRARTDRPDLGLDGAWLEAGGQQVHLLEAPVADPLGQHFALAVEELDGVVEELRSQGVKVSDPSPIGAGRQCFLQDPSGNMIELQEVGG